MDTRAISPLRFIAIALLAAAAIYFGYFLFVDRVLVRPPSDTGDSYKNLLLEATHPPRLVIEGGSSSHHGIDGELLTRALGRVTVNLGDNGGYPLLHKVYRLQHNLAPGDAVLLPVEWFQYTLASAPATYLDDLTSSLSFYYHALPWTERVAIARSITFKAWLRSLHEWWAGTGRTQAWRASRLADLDARVGSDHAGGHGGPDFVLAAEKRTPCDAYLLMNAPRGARVSAFALRALDELAKLQGAGVEVWLTSPTVVGDDCYTTEAARYDALLREISQAATQRGLRWLEQPRDTQLPGAFYRDTPYHVLAAGRTLRTERLLDRIDADLALPVTQAAGYAEVDALLSARATRALDDLPPWSGESVRVSGDPRVLFRDGWSGLEPTGRWSSGPRSTLSFDLPADAWSKGVDLVFRASYFHTPEPTDVSACGRVLAPVRLDRVPLRLDAATLAACSGAVTIELRHRHPISPAQLSRNATDTRQIKLRVNSLSYTVLDPESGRGAAP